MAREPVVIDYFSDTLCVWAYVSQVRLDELKNCFGSQVEIRHHFIPVFGCVEQRIQDKWSGKGEYSGFNEHVQDVSRQFPHAPVSPELWENVRPVSSLTSHLFLKAVQLLEESEQCDRIDDGSFERISWKIREAFFVEELDISNVPVLFEIADQLGLPVVLIRQKMESGEALAALHRDRLLQEHFHVEGSPSWVLNGGRQKLYGNVGYKVIEANVRELLERPESMASWC